jgi:hypothetical protein
MKLPVVARWTLFPIASMVACSGTVVVADAVGNTVARMITPERGQAVEAVMPVDGRLGAVYAIAAMAFVIAGSYVAPRYRAVVAVLLYTAGGCLAWWALNDWYIPEGYPRAYQPSRIPLVLTLIGGLIGVSAIVAKHFRTSSARTRSRPEQGE